MSSTSSSLRPRLGGSVASLALALTAALPAGIQAQDTASYYIGVDNLATIASGTFAGMANPNHGRLTFLYAHWYEATPSSNHYHSKGIFRYDPSSTAESPVIDNSPSNYLPEGANPPLLLSAGSGLYLGKLASQPYTDPAAPSYHFSFLEVQTTGALAGFAEGTGEAVMFNSSSGRWSASLAGADIHFELVSLSNGLHIGDATSLDIGLGMAGDDYHFGDSGSFTPMFWTEADAAPGLYTAAFRLVDEEGLFGDSGTFEYRFEVAAVPEPSTWAALAGGAVLAAAVWRRRRRAN